MTVGEKVFSVLTANAGVTALVGTSVFPNYVPKSEGVPAVVYFVVSSVPVKSLAGKGPGLVNSHVQVDAWGGSYLEAHAVAKAIVGALDHYSDGSFRSEEDSRRDLFEPDVGYHRVSLQFNVWHEEE